MSIEKESILFIKNETNQDTIKAELDYYLDSNKISKNQKDIYMKIANETCELEDSKLYKKEIIKGNITDY